MSGCICASSCRWFSGDLRKDSFQLQMGAEEAGTEITEQISAFALILPSFLTLQLEEAFIEKKCFYSLKYSDFYQICLPLPSQTVQVFISNHQV